MTFQLLVQGYGFFQGVFWAFTCMVWVIIAARLRPGWDPTSTATLSFCAVMMLGIAVCAFLGPRFSILIFMGAYAFPSLIFLALFGAIYKSLTLRMLLKIYDCERHQELYSRLFDEYLVGDGFCNRINLLIANNLTVINGQGELILTEKGCRLAKSVCFIQKILSIAKSG